MSFDILAENPDIKTIHGYDPDTRMYEYTLSMNETDLDPLLENFTEVDLPTYDIDLELIKFDIAADSWEVISMPDPLRAAKDLSKGEIDRTVRNVLVKNVTETVQDAGLYDLKYAEAIAYTEAVDPVLSDYPFLEIDTTITGELAVDCANVIINKHEAWSQKLANMELIRLTAKHDIELIALADFSSAALAKAEIETIWMAAADQLNTL